MKKHLIISLALQVFFIISFRGQAQSNLVFFTQGSEPFFVFLNGIKQNPNPGNNIKIIGVEETKFNVLIVIPHPVFSMVNNSMRISVGKESVFAVGKNVKGEYELIPKGENQLSFTPASNNQQVYKYIFNLPTAGSMPLGVGAGMNMVTGSPNQAAASYNEPPSGNNTTSGSGGSTEHLPGYHGPVGCPKPMAAQEFQYAKNTISSKPFESGKITIAKQIAGSNCLFSSQVKELMMLFSFEGTRIEFAKFAYAHTYDKGNYFIVNDAFEFDSSISDLNKHIGK